MFKMEPIGKEKTSQERIDEFMKSYERNQSMRKMFKQKLGEGWEPLGDCPLMGKLPIEAIRTCREKHKNNCHTIKINYLKKCGGKQSWQQTAATTQHCKQYSEHTTDSTAGKTTNGQKETKQQVQKEIF